MSGEGSPTGSKDKGGTPHKKCLRCERGPSYHGGHERQDPACVFFGCDAPDAAAVQKHLKQVAVAKAVQEALVQQDKVRTSPTPTAVVSSSPSSSSSSSSSSSACTRGKPLKHGRGLLCQRCLAGPGSQAKHTVEADDCILFGTQNLTPHQGKCCSLTRMYEQQQRMQYWRPNRGDPQVPTAVCQRTCLTTSVYRATRRPLRRDLGAPRQHLPAAVTSTARTAEEAGNNYRYSGGPRWQDAGGGHPPPQHKGRCCEPPQRPPPTLDNFGLRLRIFF